MQQQAALAQQLTTPPAALHPGIQLSMMRRSGQLPPMQQYGTRPLPPSPNRTHPIGSVVRVMLREKAYGKAKGEWYEAAVRWAGCLDPRHAVGLARPVTNPHPQLMYGVECWQPPNNGQGTDGVFGRASGNAVRKFVCDEGSCFFVPAEVIQPHPHYGAVCQGFGDRWMERVQCVERRRVF